MDVQVPSMPASARRSATICRRGSGTWPSKGQPNDVEIAATTGLPASCAISATRASTSSDCLVVMFTFARLWLSLAETTVVSPSTPQSIARAAPRSFGTSAT
jgi:hypothetical protein